MAFVRILLLLTILVATSAAFGNFGPGFPQLTFPIMKPFRPFPPIHVPTPEEIANINPGPNQNYQFMSSQSSSKVVRDNEGNLVREGETVIRTNNNGKVTEYKLKH